MGTVAFETVELSIGDDRVARLTLNRPSALNALSVPMFGEIAAAIGHAGLAGARALLLTGAGRGFCAGADLVDTPFPDPGDPAAQVASRQNFERVVALVRALNEAPMPVVCAVNGVAAGGGVGLALAGDIVVAARSARFVLTFVPRLGLVPDVGLTWSMARIAGRARTMAASLLGDPIGAEEAERWGLVWKVFDDERLHEEALAIARRLAAGPARAQAGLRRLVDAAPELPIAAHVVLERDVQSPLLVGPDLAEGVAAFREKRAPRFDG